MSARGPRRFQQATVDWAVDRLLDSKGSGRLLVADEVGLGKTYVAQGVIDALSKRHSGPEPFRVFYICSSLSIAAQNERRIREVLPSDERGRARVHADRLSRILEAEVPSPPARFLLYTVTPGTSFKPGTGVAHERRALAQCARKAFSLVANHEFHEAFRVGVEPTRWGASWSPKPPSWFDDAMCEDFWRRTQRTFTDRPRSVSLDEYVRERLRDGSTARATVARLRAVFTLTVVGRIRPDLVVFDEFQRFFNVLPMGDEAVDTSADADDKDLQAREIVDALLGSSLADTQRARVLMLSATPYRMYARSVDAEQHHDEFYRLLRFLYGAQGASVEAGLKGEFARYRAALEKGELDPVLAVKQQIEGRLRAVMARTERTRLLPKTYRAPKIQPHDAPLDPAELRAFRHLVASCQPEHRAYAEPMWSSVPLPMQMLTQDYALRRKADPASVPRDDGGFRLRHKALRAYRAFPEAKYPHARLRGLLDALPADVLALPWLPPSRPWWPLAAPFVPAQGAPAFSKALIFSRYRAVPRAVATLLSYEAERRCLEERAGRSATRRYDWSSRSTRAGEESAVDAAKGGTHTGLNPLPRPHFKTGSGATWFSRIAMFLPWPTLATVVDPLALAVAADGALTFDAAVSAAMARLRTLLGESPQRSERDTVWRWIVRLETRHRAPSWPFFEAAVREWRGGPEALFPVSDEGAVAPSPDELRELAEVAVAGPGMMLARAILRVFGEASVAPAKRAKATLAAALALSRYLDTPEWIVAFRKLHRGIRRDAAVRRVAWDGNLEAVLDEFLAVEQGLGTTAPTGGGASEAIDALERVLALRETHLHVSRLGEGTSNPMRLRCHAALAYGLATKEDDADAPRADAVRAAFNSPFRPMVLVTTSIGQEGLDFHRWARHLVHWDLPDNPVDLEQRDGRLNRHGSLAVRTALGAKMPVRDLDPGCSPWHAMARRFDDPAHPSGIEPWWHVDGAEIRRTLLVASFSNQGDRCLKLQRELDLYRLALGQPEQEQLLARLRRGLRDLDPSAARAWLRQAAIDLSARGVTG